VQRPANTTPGSNSDAGSRLNHTDGSRRRASASAEHAVLMPSAADQDLRLAAADLQQPSAETMKELPAATWPFAALMQGASTPWVLSWVLAANFTSALVCCPTPPMFYMAQCRPLASTCQHKQLVMPSAADNTMPPMQEPRAGASPLAVVVLGASTPWVLSWALAAKSTSALVCCPTPPMFYMAQCASLVSTCQSRHPSGSAAGTVDTLATTLSPAPVEAHSSTGGIHTGSGCSSVTTLSWWMQGRSSLCLEETAAVDPAEGAAECPSLPWWFVVVPSMAAAPAAAAVLPHQHGMVCLPASLIAVKMQLPADDVCPTAAVEAVHWNSTCPVRMLTPHSYGRDLGLNQPAQDTAQGPSQHAFSKCARASPVVLCCITQAVPRKRFLQLGHQGTGIPLAAGIRGPSSQSCLLSKWSVHCRDPAGVQGLHVHVCTGGSCNASNRQGAQLPPNQCVMQQPQINRAGQPIGVS